MEAGRVLASDAAGEVLTRLDVPLARLDAASAALLGEVAAVEREWGLLTVQLAGGGPLLHCLPGAGGLAGYAPGQRLRLRVAARDVAISLTPPEGSSALNVLPASVVQLRALDEALMLAALEVAGGVRLLARLTRRSTATLGLAEGQRVHALVKAVAVLG